ncbi:MULTISPECIES: dihydrodipicolinate synthase family protein [Corynebacterium]|uniref:Dihydrodipicolinate synthase family protein n=1 Tax=Corynebacterium hadale TaxID=2026255 RepID=A0A269PBM5_9CORY|nr:dihydrodipicolinate synthase family protein [Corynebacterium hadale]PAJ69072.1 hypothetical protein CIG21_09455 [Corynebacterium hadale]WKC61293.1 4-hydroxy-tetrahydrodipicolinate synthase [Corynebacterium hadale]
MGNINYEGVIAAAATPLSGDGERLNLSLVDSLVDLCATNGISGIIPGGTTGEFPAMSLEERFEVNSAYAEAARSHGIDCIAGVGSNSTREAVALAREACSAGADGLLVSAPFYNVATFDELVRHFNTISEAVDLPMMYYNLPEVSGLSLSADQLVELARQTRVESVKYTEGDLVKLDTLIQYHSEEVVPLCGFDGLNFAAISLGAPGSVWGMAAFLPEVAMKFYSLLTAELDIAKARELWKLILPICDALESGNYAAGIKAGLEFRGFDVGPVRGPAKEIEGEAKQSLFELSSRALEFVGN